MELNQKKVLVCGMALSGIEAAKLLCKNHASVTVSDQKGESHFGKDHEIWQLKQAGVDFYLGKDLDSIVLLQDLIILSPGVPTDQEFIIKAEKADIPVISEFELGSLFCPCPIAAITGTNGKTTTTALLGQIVKSSDERAEIVGNIGIPFTKMAPGMAPDSTCIAEVSSFQLETIQSFKPKVASILNITPDHLDRHKTFDQYVSIKKRIFENQDETDYLILNYDDPSCLYLAAEAKAKVLYFSSTAKPINGIYLNQGNMILVKDGHETQLLAVDDLKILGRHNHENAMAAALMADCMGIELHIIRENLKCFQAVAHRIEYVTEINGVKYYNDSKGTNPDAAVKSIEAMTAPIILIGGGYDKKSDYSNWVAKFHEKVKEIILIGETGDQIAAECFRQGFHHVSRARSLEEGVNTAYKISNPGEVVLLSPACASWDMFDSYEQRGNLFKEFVLRLKG